MLRYKTDISTGERAPSDSKAPAASGKLENSDEGQLQMEWKEQNTHQDEEVREEKEHKDSDGNEMQLGSQQPQTQAILMLSFSEDQSFSRAPFGKDQNVSELSTGDEQSLLESINPDESNMKETGEVSEVIEQGGSEVFSVEEVEEIDGSSYSEEVIEPSTDEELRLWRYPQDKVYKEEESIIVEEQEEDVCVKEEEEGELESSRVGKEKGGSVAHHSGPSDIQDGECYFGNVSAEIAGVIAEVESESRLDDSVKDQSTLNRDQGNIESCVRCYEEAVTGDIDIKQDEKDTEGFSTRKDDVCQQSKEIQTVNIKEEDMDLESDRGGPNGTVKQTEASPFADVAQALKATQTGYTEFERNIEDVAKPKVETEAVSSDSDGAQCLTEVQVPDHLLETEEMEQDAIDERQGVVYGLTGEIHSTEGGESSKKVTFILEPELINDSTLSETNTSMESRAETSMSGENSNKV